MISEHVQGIRVWVFLNISITTEEYVGLCEPREVKVNLCIYKIIFFRVYKFYNVDAYELPQALE